MEKTMLYNSQPIMNLQTLISIVLTSWTMWYDNSDELELSIKNKIGMFNEIQSRYNWSFNNEKFIKNMPIKYIKHALSYLNKLIKETDKHEFPWFAKVYIDFTKEHFAELMTIYKKGGWDKQ